MSRTADMNRRKFMEIGIYTISSAMVIASGSTLADFAVGPSFNLTRAQWVEIEAGKLLLDGGSFNRVVLEYEAKDGWLTKKLQTLVYVQLTKKENVIAISAGCTHLGCVVTWDQDQKVFKCPCHDGRYDATGNVLSGPPPVPLNRHPAKIIGGKVYLRTDTVPFEGKTNEGF